MAEDSKGYKQHAIQLIGLKVLELSIVANPEVEDPQNQIIEDNSFWFSVGSSKYDQAEHQIGVIVGIEIGKEGENHPFVLKVSLAGAFQVDESRFPMEHIEDWADKNAPLVLYPYLREHVHGLTSRAGFRAALLPLIEIPTYRVIKESQAQAVQPKI